MTTTTIMSNRQELNETKEACNRAAAGEWLLKTSGGVFRKWLWLAVFQSLDPDSLLGLDRLLLAPLDLVDLVEMLDGLVHYQMYLCVSRWPVQRSLPRRISSFFWNSSPSVALDEYVSRDDRTHSVLEWRDLDSPAQVTLYLLWYILINKIQM